jgi:hypothetical protein
MMGRSWLLLRLHSFLLLVQENVKELVLPIHISSWAILLA